MNDWQRETRADYHRKGFASRSGYGRSPALVIVDFIKGFTDPTTPLGGDFAWANFRFSTPRLHTRPICMTRASS